MFNIDVINVFYVFLFRSFFTFLTFFTKFFRSLYCKVSYLIAEEHWSHTNLGIWQSTYDSVCKDNSWIHGKRRQRFLSNVYKRFFLFSPRFFYVFNGFFLIFISTFITSVISAKYKHIIIALLTCLLRVNVNRRRCYKRTVDSCCCCCCWWWWWWWWHANLPPCSD